MLQNIEHNKDLYFVAVKIFLMNGNDLLITKDRFGSWDIPGGRLRENDFETSLEDVVERKIKEELGNSIKYKLSKPIIFMRHERDEILVSGNKEKRRIFAIGYKAKYLNGNLELGKNHEVKGNCDAELVMQTMVDIKNYDKAMLITGDGDFHCLVNYLSSENKLLKVLAPSTKNCSSLVKKAAGKNISFVSDLKYKLEYKRKGPFKDKP